MTAGTVWSNAYKGRLSPSDARIGEGALPRINARLNEELKANRLPFLNMPYWPGLKKDLAALAPELKTFRHMVVLGIGGSALGARALQKAFFTQQDQPGHQGPWLWIADNIDAKGLEAWLKNLPPKETMVVAVSKSGGTIETLAQYFLLKEWLQKNLGDNWRQHMLLVTDDKSGFMRQQADAFKLKSLPVPDYLGGRYSVLSAVGLVPAAFLGIDYEELVRGMSEACAPLNSGKVSPEDLASHQSWRLAVWNKALMERGYSQIIFFTYLPQWASFGAWFGQLWAESLGKDGLGSMPLPALGVTDQHSLVQMFLDGPRDKGCLFLTCPALPEGPRFSHDLPDKYAWLRGRGFGALLQAEALGTRMALTKRGTPLVELRREEDSPYAMGRLMGLLEGATLLTGCLMGINPLDQPAVELGKRLANARLGAPGYESETADLEAFLKAEGPPERF